MIPTFEGNAVEGTNHMPEKTRVRRSRQTCSVTRKSPQHCSTCQPYLHAQQRTSETIEGVAKAKESYVSSDRADRISKWIEIADGNGPSINSPGSVLDRVMRLPAVNIRWYII